MGFYGKLSACILALVAYGIGLWLFPFALLTFLLGIFICSLMVSLLHELGHFLSYRLLKLQWKRLTLSCVTIEQGKGVCINKERSLFAAGCTCTYDPCVPFWRYRIALLSGGVFCLLLCGLAIVSCCFLSGRLWAFSLSFAVASGLNALVNLLLPFSADRVLLKQIKQERENTA